MKDTILSEMGLTPWRLRHGNAHESNDALNADHGQSLIDDDVSAHLAVAEDAHERKSPPPPPRASLIAAMNWDQLPVSIAECVACGLCKERHHTVPGVGDKNARWLFIGEGPGAEEDARGEPFVGQAGKLLDQMLLALGLKRGEDVYIANVVKCRPPGNRAPLAEEAAACRPYLERQITLIAPQVIVALGKTAASLLLNTEDTVASLRHRVHRYQNVPLVVTYHPAYLLRTLTDKAKSWEDLLFARRVLNEGGGGQ
ncbi:MAG: uracil-DNA glycosylase [Burkholderiales bacterium]|jgi:DNA polymerase|nr:uracil-DNA glycosylase [Burkholderiales bacterium]